MKISNSIFETNMAGTVGGGIACGPAGVRLEMHENSFTDNTALADGAALYMETPASVRISDTVLEPFLPGATTVFISGQLGGCSEHPCQPGFSCGYDKYSLTCTRCAFPQVSPDGLSCAGCLAGSGPNEMRSGCEECHAGEYSTFGVCLATPTGYTNSSDHTGLVDIDECAIDHGGCDMLAVKIGSCDYLDGAEVNCRSPCKNEPGGYRCGPCPYGFERNQDSCVLPRVSNRTSVDTVRPQAQLELTTEGFDTETQQNELIDNVVALIAASLQIHQAEISVELPEAATRRLQGAAAFFVLICIVSDDAPWNMANLAARLRDPSSSLISSGRFPVQYLQITYVCPPGMTRSEGEAVCRKCLWPQFTGDRTTCEDCPARQSPTPRGDACQCADEYYSSSVDQLVCLDDEYDEEVVASLNELATLPGSEVCRVCPKTRLGAPCAVCVAGALPAVIPGFRERNELLPSGQLLRFAFRCGDSRITRNVTAERCPALDFQDDPLVPHLCGDGYVGALCLACIADFHHVDNRCEECFASRASSPMFWIVMMVVGGLPCFILCHACRNAYVERKRVKSGEIDGDEVERVQGSIAAYFCPGNIDQVRVGMRSAFQPFRILVSYMQVTSQVGPVLRIKFPDVFEEIVQLLKSVSALLRGPLSLANSHQFILTNFDNDGTTGELLGPPVQR
eukprot:COSAG02_NODE_2514_length_8624_cov_12.683050_2_plen_680_part_00